MLWKFFHRSRMIVSTLVFALGIFFLPQVQAATSTSYSLDSSDKHAESSSSAAYSLCSKIPFSITNGSSTSYQLMANLNCLNEEEQGGGGRRRVCGDGVVIDQEQCDDGNDQNGDGCSSLCRYEVCGDAVLQPSLGEQCDDGNLSNGDGCSDRCFDENTIFPGGGGVIPPVDPIPDPDPQDPVTPEVPEVPVVFEPVCGNAVLEAPEQCDDGNRRRGDGCDRFCQEEPDEDVPEEELEALLGDPTEPFYGAAFFAQCGNAILEIGEQCDDGNIISGDGCNLSCFIEALPVPIEQIITVPVLKYLEEELPRGIDYLTNDPSTLFFEQFPEGSGEYEISLIGDDGKIYELEVVVTDEGYFSFQLLEDLGDGFYTVRVEDLKNDEKVLDLILEVKEGELIEAPFLLQLGQYDLVERKDFLGLVVDTNEPVLQGQTPLPATIAVYSEFFDRTFVVSTDENNQFFFSYFDKLVAGFSDRLSIVAHYENGKVSREAIVEILYPGTLKAVESEPLLWCFRYFDPLFWAFISTLFLIVLTIFIMGGKLSDFVKKAVDENLLIAENVNSSFSRIIKTLLLLVITMAVIFFGIINVLAATTTPNLVPYEGVLKNAAGVAVSTSQDFRFSFWLDADFTAGVDRDGAGAIPGASPGYSGFSEVQSVTPDSSGFFNLNIGSVGGTIPDFIFTTHLFIQVEVKASGTPDTAYETLDVDGVDNANDRQALGTLPYSRNSDFIDNRELGTSSGDIALLGTGDVFPTVFIPGGTDVDVFEIDADDNAPGNIKLSFGDILNNQILEWDPNGVGPADGWFNFTDDVNITGDLTITGTVNGVTIGPKNNAYQYTPDYPNTSIQGDGTNNRGKLESFFIDTDGAAAPNNFNYYRWSTRQTTLQDMDLVARFRLPDDFSSFQTIPLILRYRTTDNTLTNNKIDVSVLDSTGTLVPGMSGNTNLVNGGSFATTNITFGGGTFTAGQEITLIIKMSTLNTNFADVSDITLNITQN